MIKMREGSIKLFGWLWPVKEIKHKKLGPGIEIDFTSSLGVPGEFTFKNLFALSEMFGTLDIDWNSISEQGMCDTCDYGSRYGFEIQIYHITQNIDNIIWDD